MTRILVTGGAGYIGSHTAKALAQFGFEPVVFDDLSTGNPWAVKWGPLVEANLLDKVALRRAIRTYKIEAVIHFAASAYVGESVVNPRKYFTNNVVGTLSLLDALLDSDVGQIVFSSSCATYGIPTQIPISEDVPQSPINPYGTSKLMVEKVLQAYARAYGLRWVSLRYFNAAGADPEGEIGESHDPETHLIPLAIYSALGVAPELRVLGLDYPTADGTAVRDYIHVMDLATAHIQALKYLQQDGSSIPLNLGTGEGHSVLEVIDAVERVSSRRVPFRADGRRAGDPPVLLADATNARAVLDWEPKFNDLERIVETAWLWHSRFERPGVNQ